MRYKSLFLVRILLSAAFCTSYTYALEHHLVNWYPTAPTELSTKLIELDHTAQQQYNAPTDKKIRALIVPHAGYTYSGAVAAAAYRLLDPTTYSTVIVLCPSHTTTFDGIALPTAQYYDMPHGTLIINKHIIKKLANKSPFIYNNQVFEHEHAIEIQLPLLQKYLNEFTLIPMIIGTVTDQQLDQAAHELKAVINKKTLVVVSSDFTHYGTRFNFTPFVNNQFLRIKQLDNQALGHIQRTESKEFADFIKQTSATICGSQPISLLLHLITHKVFENIEPHIIAYAQSAHITNNTQESVSYAALTFTNQTLSDLPAEQQFNQFERSELLTYARSTLKHLFEEKEPAHLYAPIKTNALYTTHGAFVTLKIKDSHQLRGCIGNIIGYEPLVPTIMRLTKDAALHDTRFTPVQAQEIPNLTLEISILTTPRRIKNTEEIIVGTHGIILHHNNHQAVYLPEVAPEQGWNLNTTLDSLSQKAGLPAQAWRDSQAWFEVFESIKFKE